MFEDGFETGNFGIWWRPTGLNPSVTSGDAHHGNYKAVLNVTNQYAQHRFTSLDYCFMRAYVMFKSFPTSGAETTVLGLYNWETNRYMAEARVGNVSGIVKWRLRYYNGASFIITSEQQKPVLDTWYCVEVCGKSNSTTNAESRMYINGNELTDVSQTGTNNTMQITCGYLWANTAVTRWYDCVIIDMAYIGPETTDASPPKFSNISANTSLAGKPCSFNCLINDNANISSYIFSTNNTGTWTNNTAVKFSHFFNATAAWANVTKTLNETVGNVVSYLWYANDTSNNWSHSNQYNITTGTLQHYLAVISPYGTPGGEGWYNDGSTAYASLDTGIVDQGNGTQRVFVNWSGDASGTNFAQSSLVTMDSNKTAVALWKTQYKVTFTQTGLDESASGTVVIVNGITTDHDQLPYSIWIDSGATLTYSYNNVSSTTGGKRFILTSVSGQPSPITITSPVLIQGDFKIQYQVIFDQTGIGSDFTGAIVTVDEATYAYTSLPSMSWWDASSLHTFSFLSPLDVNAGKRYNWTSTSGLSSLQSGTLAINGPGSVTGNYGTQIRYHITFDIAGVEKDFAGTAMIIDDVGYTLSQLPISFWWEEGSSHTFSFESPLIITANSKRYVWMGTTGLSTLQSETVLISVSGNISANCKTQFYLTATSPRDSPTPASGWFDSGTNITAAVASPVDGSIGVRYVCTGWTGTGDVPSSGTDFSVSFTISQSSSITWNWKTQYSLVVLTDPDGLTPQPLRDPIGEALYMSSWWYEDSSYIYLTAQRVDLYIFSHWVVDGTSQGDGINPIVIHMGYPRQAVAYYSPSDITPPEITVLSPENRTYYTTSISLEFTIDEAASRIWYSIDNQANATIIGNTTLVVQEGSHKVILYANDSAGNLCMSSSVYFTVHAGISDIASIRIQNSKTVVGQNYIANINVTIENQGDYLESFNVTLYANTTIIGTSENVMLPLGANITLTFAWNTTGVAFGKFTISASVTHVPGETDTTDNTLEDGLIVVTILGDINGDFKVDGKDVAIVAKAFNTKPGDLLWNPNADTNGDGKVDGRDLAIVAKYFNIRYF
jgi:hypothetical protein